MPDRDYDDSKLTLQAINEIVHNALSDLYAHDLVLLENDVSERAITHKLAEYIQRYLPGFDVDCEYNRNVELGQYSPKTIKPIEETRKKILTLPAEVDKALEVSTYPDIIVHRRLKNDKNLLVVEVKKLNSNIDIEFDRQKLSAFTGQDHPNNYHYRYGVLILIPTRSKEIGDYQLQWYFGGNKLENNSRRI